MDAELCQKQLTAFVKPRFFTLILDCKKDNIIVLSWRSDLLWWHLLKMEFRLSCYKAVTLLKSLTFHLTAFLFGEGKK